MIEIALDARLQHVLVQPLEVAVDMALVDMVPAGMALADKALVGMEVAHMDQPP